MNKDKSDKKLKKVTGEEQQTSMTVANSREVMVRLLDFQTELKTLEQIRKHNGKINYTNLEDMMKLINVVETGFITYSNALLLRKINVSGQHFYFKYDKGITDKGKEWCENLIRFGIIDKAVKHLLDGIGKGFSVLGLGVDRKTDNLLYPKLYELQQYLFNFDNVGKVIQFRDKKNLDLYPNIIDNEDFVIFYNNINNAHPLMQALSINILPYFYDTILVKSKWLEYLMSYGKDLTIAKIPTNLKDSERKEIKQAIEDLHKNNATMLTNNIDLEIVASKNKDDTSQAFLNYFDLLDDNVTKYTLGQTTTTKNGSSNYSQAGVQKVTQDAIIFNDTKSILLLVNEIVKKYYKYNFGSKAMPVLCCRPNNVIAPQARVDMITKLYSAGFKVDEDYIANELGIDVEYIGDTNSSDSVRQITLNDKVSNYKKGEQDEY